MKLTALSIFTASILLFSGCGDTASTDNTIVTTTSSTPTVNYTLSYTGVTQTETCSTYNIGTLTINGNGNTFEFIDCVIDKIIFNEDNTALKLSGTSTINSFEYGGTAGNSVEASQTILDIITDNPSLHEITIY